MLASASGFTAEERDNVRSIAHNLLVSWKKESNLGSRTFTIGVSSIEGNDLIGIDPGAIGSPSNYNYFDESDYVMSMSWERSLKTPIGGLSKAMGEATLNNTNGRFTPRYMGGDSELFTSMVNRRPFIINAGFNYGGIDQTLPQFAGVTTRPPVVDMRSRRASIQGSDYIDYFQNRIVDKTTMFTSQTTDVVIESLLSQLGMSTAQYELDPGINVVPFGLFEKGTRFADIIDELVEAENGQFYQDENGRFIFANRQHWQSSPHNSVTKVLYTAQVLSSIALGQDQLINVVEVKAPLKKKQPEQPVLSLDNADFLLVPKNGDLEYFFEFNDPVLQLTHPTSSGKSYFLANSKPDGTGTNLTSSISIINKGTFAKVVKYKFTNSSAIPAYITKFVLSGRTVRDTGAIYHRAVDSSSITAYEERPYIVENPYIQDPTWAESLAQMLLDDYSEPGKVQQVTVRAMPDLQLGDLISWQGRYWRIYDIKTKLSNEGGFIQDLTIIQGSTASYFRIGISEIGGEDLISP